MSCARARAALVFACLLPALPAAAQSPQPPRKLGEMEVTLLGLQAGVDPLEPVVPKNVAAGLRIVVRAGGRGLTAAELRALLGGPFQVQGELSGPGLAGTLSLPVSGPGAPPSPDPLVLSFPGLPQGGEYELSNLRLVRDGRIVLDVTPRHVTLRVIDQILVTSVQTQALSLDEIRARGIVLDSDAYLGFQFNVQVLVESTPVQLDFPVVFDREGVALPLPLQPPPEPLRSGHVVRAPLMVPVLLKPPQGPTTGGDGELPPLSLPDGQPVRIPSLLVIPGNVGYLKQFFSAQLVVANGAPHGSGLVVHNVSATIVLPPGADGVPNTGDDPLILPPTETGPQSPTQPVLREDGTGMLLPGEQGRAELTLRGEKEGFHALEFQLAAELDGLAVGPVELSGVARGGVLVRNAYLDTTFTLPSVVRADEEFSAFVTVTNIGQGTAQDVDVTLDSARLSGATLLTSATQTIDTLEPGDAHMLEYRFRSRVTGQVVASYLKFDTNGGTDVTGRLAFTLGVGERGVALSPDTLVLPAAVDALPPAVVRAAMRVLGQAWSVATAPTLPAGVAPITTATVTRKALALAEAGLRVKLRGASEAARRDALRDLLLDLHGGQDGVDAGFDELLRGTQAGAALDAALGALLAAPLSDAGGALEYELQLAELASSGAPFVSFAVEGAGGASLPAGVVVLDAQGRRLALDGPREVARAVLVRAGTSTGAPLIGAVAAPGDGVLTLQLNGSADGLADLSISVPGPDGATLRAEVRALAQTPLSRARVVYTPGAADPLVLQQDAAGDGVYETQQVLSSVEVSSQGPRLLAALTIGPETITGATPLGVYAAILFDRVVDADDARTTANYVLERNTVLAARRQLSGRLVFAALAQPEGPLVPVNLEVSDVRDARGRGGAAQSVVVGSRLDMPGALVSGRVLQSDGTPVGGARVVYGNVWSADCAHAGWDGVASQETDEFGRFEFRYVLQSPCGSPFRIDTRDPLTGAARGVKLFVQSHGQRMMADLVLLGRGSVAGRVFRGDGSAAPGARVRVASLSDSQVAGHATADSQGDYLVRNLPVGPVAVTAVLGVHLGRAAGTIAAAGATAQVPVSLDGEVTISGTVYKLQEGVLSVVPGIDVVYYRDGSAFGVATSDAHGGFELAGMPPGNYQLNASLNARDRVWVSGSAAAGQTVSQNLVIDVLGSASYGTVRGQVRLANGSPAAGAWVSDMSAAATTADADGRYELTGVAVRPLVQTLRAVSADGRRSGTASVVVSSAGQVVDNVDVQLSGLGRAEFYVRDSGGQALAGQTVALLGNCLHPCGCRFVQSDATGVARFDGVPLGSVSAQAVRVVGGVSVDAVQASAVVSDEETAGAATLRFLAPGRVSVTVTEPDGAPAHAAEVKLTSLAFVNDGVLACGLVPKHTRTGRTDAQTGQVVFQGVHAGPVSVEVSSLAFPHPVYASGALDEGAQVSLALRLVNTLAGEVSGQVLMPDGNGPVSAGVDVTASAAHRPDVTVTTDAAGRYRFAAVLPAGTYQLTARDTRPGGTGSVTQTRVALVPGVNAVHDLRLKARGSVRITVVDGADQPADAVLVRLRESEFPGLVQERAFVTAASQPLELTGVFSGPLSVEASDALGRGGRASAVLPPDGQTIDVKVRLTTTGHVRGHFYLPDGRTAVPNATVKLISGSRVIGQVTTLADSDVGSFVFSHVPAGTVRLEAEDPRTGRTGVAVGTLEREGQLVLLDVRAQGLGRVQGVVTLNGQPQPSAEVSLRSGRYHVRMTSDAGGLYAVEGVPEGQIAVTADLGASLLAGTAAGVLAGDGQTLELPVALRGAGAIDGQLLDADGVSPGRVSTITLRAFGSTQTTASDPSGSFHFDLVPEGPVELVADALQSIDCARQTFSVTGGQTLQAALRLRGVGGLEGIVTNTAGPVSGTLTVVGTGTGAGCTGGWGWSVQVGSSGAFQFPEMVAGPVTLSFVAGQGLSASRSETVTPGVTTQTQLQLEPSGEVTGILRHENGSASIGAGVTVVASGNRWLTGQTRADGSFRVRGVPVGAVLLFFRDTSTGGLARLNATVADNATTDVGIVRLYESALSVVGTSPAQGASGVATNAPIVLTFSAPLAHNGGIQVLVNGSVRSSYTATLTTDGDGLSLVPWTGWPDSAEVEVQANSYVSDVLGRRLWTPFSLRFRTVDLSPPKVASVTPAHGAIEIASNAVVRVTFDEPLDTTVDLQPIVQVSAGTAGVSGSVSAESPTTLVFTPAAALPINTRYTVTVNGARDLGGRVQTTSFSSSFATLDTVAPSVVPWTPTPGAWTNSTRPRIQVVATDATSGPALSAAVRIDGQPYVMTRSSDGWYYYDTPVAFADGVHTYTATVADRAGNATDFTASFGIDTQPPAPGVMISPTEGQVLSGTVRLRGSASDGGSGVASAYFRRGASWWTATIDGSTFYYDWVTGWESEGAHSLGAQVMDRAGHYGPIGPLVTVYVNNQVLTTSITAPPSSAAVRDAVSVTATVSEPVARVEFQAGALPAVSDDTAPYAATLDLSTLPEGNVTLTVTAVGVVPGETAVAGRTVVIDRTPPAAPIAARIYAESDGTSALVLGQAGAVEGGVVVEALNLDVGGAGQAAAATDGSFALRVPGVIGHTLSLTALDVVGNRSAAVQVTVTQQTDPDGVPLAGLKLWVRSDDGVTADANGRVSLWQDRSGSLNHLTQATSAQQPLLVPNALAGLPTLRFDGVNDGLLFTTRLSNSIRTVFWVLKVDPAGTSAFRFLFGDASTTHFHPGGPNLWNSSTSAAIRDGQTWLNAVRVDGLTTAQPTAWSVLSVVTTSGVTADRLAQQPGVSGAWWGEIAEVLVYDQALSGSDRKSVEDYLARRYVLYAPQVSMPTITPQGGSFSDATTVTITTRTPGATTRYTLDGQEPDGTSTLYTGPFTLEATTTVKAKAFRAGFPDSATAVAGFVKNGGNAPQRFNGLALWVRADAGIVSDSADRVSAWRDLSGRGNDLVQPTGSMQPLLVRGVSNGLPAVRFDGTNDFMLFGARLAGTIRSVFAVLREDPSSTAGDRFLLGDRVSTTYDFYPGYSSIWSFSSTSSSIRNGQTWLNGVLVNGTTTPRPRTPAVLSVVTTGGVSADRLGQHIAYGAVWHGDIAELVIYERALTASERKAVEDYLVAKYRPYTPTVGAPEVTPNGGSFTGSVSVSLTSTTPGAEIRYTLDGTQPSETNGITYDAPFELAQTTTVKARAHRLDMNPSPLVAATFASDADFTPASVANLALWARSDAGLPTNGGERVDRWVDQSGRGNDLVQTLGTSQPLLVPDAGNGLPALRFDGTDDFLLFSTRLSGTIRSVFVVLREDAAAINATRHVLGDATSTTTSFQTGTTTLWNSSSTPPSILNGQTWLNGAPIDGATTARPRAWAVLSVVTTGGVSADRLFRHGSYAGAWHGDIAELVIYDRALTPAERKRIEDYLAAKYRPYTPTVAAPEFTPNGGRFMGSTSVSLASTTPGAEIRYTLDGSQPSATNGTTYTDPFPLTQTTTVTAVALRAGMNPSAAVTVTFLSDAGFTPANLNGLTLWLRADAGLSFESGARVFRWADQSAAGNHAVLGSALGLPALSGATYGGLPALRFDGVDDWLALSARNDTIRTVAWVVRQTSATTTGRFLLGDATSGSYDFYGGYTTLWSLSDTALAIRNGQTRLNGVAINGTTTARPAQMSVVSVLTTGAAVRTDRLMRHPNWGAPWLGDLAEVIVYDRVLTLTELKQVEQYLGARYGITVQP